MQYKHCKQLLFCGTAQCRESWWLQVLLAQWQPAKALEHVMAATKAFHQATTIRASQQAAEQQADKLQQPDGQLQPSLWLQCRFQVMPLQIFL